MWGKIGASILRYRLPLAIMLIAFTAFMAYEAQFVRMSYKFAGVLPKDDSTYIEYDRFVKQFSEDGNVLVIGYRDPQYLEAREFPKVETTWK